MKADRPPPKTSAERMRKLRAKTCYRAPQKLPERKALLSPQIMAAIAAAELQACETVEQFIERGGVIQRLPIIQRA